MHQRRRRWGCIDLADGGKQAVADFGNRFNVSWRPRIVGKRAPQFLDRLRQYIGRGDAVFPDPLEQLIAGHRVTGVPRQFQQHRCGLAGQARGVGLGDNAQGAQINHMFADAQTQIRRHGRGVEEIAAEDVRTCVHCCSRNRVGANS